MKKVTTYSGAVYIVEGSKVTGGSKGLKDGTLQAPPMIGRSMTIATPERHHLNPHFGTAGVMTSTVISIEEMEHD